MIKKRQAMRASYPSDEMEQDATSLAECKDALARSQKKLAKSKRQNLRLQMAMRKRSGPNNILIQERIVSYLIKENRKLKKENLSLKATVSAQKEKMDKAKLDLDKAKLDLQ